MGNSSTNSVITGAVTIAATATPIGPFTCRTITVLNPTGAAQTVFIGDANVTTANGFPLVVGAANTEKINLSRGGGLFGIVAAGTEEIRFIATV